MSPLANAHSMTTRPNAALEPTAARRVNYRKLAFSHYPPFCAHCGYGIPDVLEVAHIDGDRTNNAISNLIILCPNCHKMHDLDLISTQRNARTRNLFAKFVSSALARARAIVVTKDQSGDRKTISRPVPATESKLAQIRNANQ
jgi:predicted restriction endonuclease